MQVIETDGWTARCRGAGGERPLRLTTLADEVAPGDWVLAHMDSAVQVLTEEEAEAVRAALDALAAAMNGEDHEAHLEKAMAGVALPSRREDAAQ